MILECFEYNQHFVAMMNIINSAKRNNLEGKFEKHHIIPRCFYKKMNLPVDDSDSNLVKLTFEEHQKVHQLAALCAKEIVIYSLKFAANLMGGRQINFCGENSSFFGKTHSEETKEKISRANSSKNHPNFGQHLSLETKEKISRAHLGKGHNQNEETKKQISEKMIGRKLSKETRKKMSDSKKGKPSNRKGCKLSEETRKKMSEARKRKEALR